MVIAKKVLRRKPPQDWRKGLDDIIRRKHPVKLILLHTCQDGHEFAVNPELILEIGNTTEEEAEGHEPEDEVRILESRTSTDPFIHGQHEIVLTLASMPFKVGDRIGFSGLTRVPQLNGVEITIRNNTSVGIAGYQAKLGAGNHLIIHNFTITFPVIDLGPETGMVFKIERNTTCGFVSCCGGEKIETRESMEMILLMIMRSNIGTVYDPTGAIDRMASEEIGQ